MLANGATDKEDKQKVAIFLNIPGLEALDAQNSLLLSQEEEATYKTVPQKLEKYCTPRNNEIFERYNFYMGAQKEVETLEEFD